MNKKYKVICLIHEAFEDLEFWYPVLRCMEANVEVVVVGEYKGRYTGKYGVHADAGYTYDEIDYKNYDGLLIPGGWAPDKMRRFPKVLEITRHFVESNKPVGTICHAGWVLASADCIKGRLLTSTPGIKDDLIHAGAKWADEPVVMDGNLISSRSPADLPYYMKKFLEVLFK